MGVISILRVFKATGWVRVARESVDEKENRPEMSYPYLFLEAKCQDPLLTSAACKNHSRVY